MILNSDKNPFLRKKNKAEMTVFVIIPVCSHHNSRIGKLFSGTSCPYDIFGARLVHS